MSYRKLEILCDMDAILVDLTPYWLKCIADDHGVTETIDNITQWSLHKCGNLIPLGAAKVYDYLKKPGFFLNAPEIPSALTSLALLQSLGHDVMIVSSPSSAICAKEKIDWLAQKAPWLKPDQIALMTKKTKVRGDVLIDDHPETLVEYRRAWPTALTVGIEYPYNKDIVGPLLVKGHGDYVGAWQQILQAILQLSQGVSR